MTAAAAEKVPLSTNRAPVAEPQKTPLPADLIMAAAVEINVILHKDLCNYSCLH